jgi:hypothetical protein
MQNWSKERYEPVVVNATVCIWPGPAARVLESLATAVGESGDSGL